MYGFEYHRPASLAEASALLGRLAEAKPLAGGQTLIATLKLRLARPSDLVDLDGIEELHGIRVEGNTLVIGAMTRHAEVAASTEVKRRIPALADLAEGIGDRQVRAMGTIGGAVANADPASDYGAAVLGLGATISTSRRRIAADDFFTALFETALEPGELITSVAFPIPRQAAYAKFPSPASRYALVGVMVGRADDGTVRVAVTGAADKPFRVPGMEKALAADFSARAIEGIRVAPDGLNADIHGSAAYRAHLIGVMAKRAVIAAGV